MTEQPETHPVLSIRINARSVSVRERQGRKRIVRQRSRVVGVRRVQLRRRFSARRLHETRHRRGQRRRGPTDRRVTSASPLDAPTKSDRWRPPLSLGEQPTSRISLIASDSAPPALPAHIDASLCQVLFWWRVLDAGNRPCLGAGLVVGLVLGPGSDLSEEPVYQGVSRPRWNQRRPWVSSRTHYRS
jgi:hypothetical protein